MIIFHEGLPRSGKSYEAMAVRIIPAIKAGRHVLAYVEGINHDQIAELAGVTPERCRELLHAITREQIQTTHVEPKTQKERIEDNLPTLAMDNALVVVDEAQNFWGNKAKLGPGMTQFITEHGHRGIDIVLMGQDLRDVHAVWRRRVEIKLSFLKLNGLTVPPWARRFLGNLAKPSYSVTTYRHLGGDQFSRAGMTVTAYDPKYFGTYKSFVAADTNTEVYTDKRAQVWSHPLMKYGMPAMAGAAIWGAITSWNYFHPEPKKKAQETTATTETPKATKSVAQTAQMPAATAAASAPAVDNRAPMERRLADLTTRGRIRLAGLASMGDRTTGVVEWVQGGNVVIERLTLDTLRTLGVAVMVSGDLVQIAIGDYRELATPWPLEDMGRVSENRQASIRGPQQITASSQLPEGMTAGASPPTFIDAPGPISKQPTVGSSIRNAAKGG